MSGKKQLLASLLMSCGGIWLLNQINRLVRRKLLILAYHRICDINVDESRFPSDIDLVSASKDQFDWQMNYLKNNYTVVTFREYEVLSLKDKLTKDFVIITFDDGFKDNYETAFPILMKHGLPAVFYISTDYVGTTERFWFEYLVSIIQQIPDNLVPDTCNIIGISKHKNRQILTDTALAHLKQVSNDERLKIIENLELFVKSNDFLSETDSYPMDWNNIREMHDHGMEIGSHTLSHPILTNMDKTHSRAEIENSKAEIDRALKTECVSISYPNGQQGEFNSKIIDQVKGSNYRYACSYISGTNSHDIPNRYELRRIHVERYTTNSYFRRLAGITLIICLANRLLSNFYF